MTLLRAVSFSKSIAGSIAGILLLAFAHAAAADTFRDTFSSAAYNNQNGSQSWLSNWSEAGDDNSATGGGIQVTGNRLLIQGTGIFFGSTNSISRSANLSAYTAVTLSFDYEVAGFESSDSVAIQVRSGGSGNWTTLATFTNANSNGSVSYSISSSLITANTEIRFSQSGLSSFDEFFVDNILLTATPNTAIGSGTYLDRFSSVAYSNQDGTLNWSSNWIEEGDDGSPSGGDIDITGGRLHLQDDNNSISRSADLSAATSVILSFDYEENTFNNNNKWVEVQVSTGGAWTTLQRFQGASVGSGSYSTSLSSAFFSSAFELRFITSSDSSMNNNDDFYLDNVRLDAVFGPVAPPVALAEYLFEEPGWAGATGEVTDTTGTYNARAIGGPTTAITSPAPAIPGDPGTCRFGNFDGNNDYVELPSTFPNLTGSFTVAGWIYAQDNTQDHRIMGDDESNGGGYGFSLGDGGTGRLRFFSRAINPVSIDTQTAVIGLNNWYFVTAVHNSTAKTRQLYVNGVAQTLDNGSTSSTYTGTWGTDNGTATIGGEGIGGGSEAVPRWRFNGRIDDVRIFSSALSASQIASLYTSTHACSAGVDHFDIDHNSTAIYCAATPVTVTAEDVSGNTESGYTGTITIDTQSGLGNWSVTTGNGSFDNGTDNDGVATYTFDASDNGVVVFSLDHSDTDTAVPLSLDIAVTDGAASDDNLEGTLDFFESGFTITGTVLTNNPPNPINTTLPIATQTAGTNFNVFIAAYGQTPEDASCGVIESYNGNKTLTLSATYNDPTSGTITPTYSASPTVFSNGQAQIAVKYKDVGGISLQVNEGSLTGSSTIFVVKPASFDVQLAGNPAATNASGGVFTISGANFPVTVFVRDAEGSLTPNYGKEVAAEGIRLDRALVAPVGGNAGALTGSLLRTANATFTGNYQWNEVGIISLTANVEDDNYLAAGNVQNTVPNVGRFIPDRFDIATGSGSVTPANTTGADFTYFGQPFFISFDLVAYARAPFNTPTQNYFGAFAKLDLTRTGTLSEVGTTADVAYGAVDITPTSYNNRVTPAAVTPVWAAGTASIAGLPVAIERGAVIEAPVSDIAIGVLVEDSDGVTFAVLDLDSDVVATDDSIKIGDLPGDLRFGRLIIPPVYAPDIPSGGATDVEPVPFQTQYFNGTAFVASADDNTSYYLSGNCNTGCPPVALGSLATNPVTAGQSNVLNEPTVTRPGTPMEAVIELTVESWLQFNWDGSANYDQNPTSTITFGRYRGHDRVIYWREL